MLGFLALPERTTRPRESGLTQVLDKGERHRQARLGPIAVTRPLTVSLGGDITTT